MLQTLNPKPSTQRSWVLEAHACGVGSGLYRDNGKQNGVPLKGYIGLYRRHLRGCSKTPRIPQNRKSGEESSREAAPTEFCLLALPIAHSLVAAIRSEAGQTHKSCT